MRAIILAGGQGSRLRPFTTLIPKPLVPIGGEKSILEIIIQQLARCGFSHITITVNHLAHLIQTFLGNGEQWGVTIDYSRETKPLGTIGPLTLIPDLPENFLVMNGDILCNIDYGALLREHAGSGSEVTVATFQRDAKIDFGVLEYDPGDYTIRSFREKPTYHFDVSMGIYCIRRSVIERLTPDVKYGFDELMLDGIREKRRYRARPFDGFWLDIGRPDDYDYCNENYASLKRELGLE